MKTLLFTGLTIFCVSCTVNFGYAQENTKSDTAGAKNTTADLAKKLANPVANLISVPFQNNTDYGIGEYNGSRNTLNFQPVVPLVLSTGLNMIIRVIAPVVSQKDITGAGNNEFGLSDINTTVFFAPTGIKHGLTFAAGPVFLIPAATNKLLGKEKLGIGPSILALKQTGTMTFGAMLNQLWSVAGNTSREALSQLFIQPFLNHNWKSGAAIGLNAELTQDWNNDSFSGFINASISGVTKLGSQTVQLSAGPRIPVAGPSASRPDFGFRSTITLVFPK